MLEKSKKALKITFWRTAEKIKINSPSITIPFRKYASENIDLSNGKFARNAAKHSDVCFFHILRTNLAQNTSVIYFQISF